MENMKLCKGCLKELHTSSFSKNKTEKDGLQRRCKPCNKIYRDSIKDKHSEYRRKYDIDNKDYLLAKRRNYEKVRHTDPKNKLKRAIRSYTSRVIRKKGLIKCRKFNEYLGCSVEHLIAHLESQFKDGMNWSNYGKWEIDHIKPISLASSIKDVYELNHYTNLQPLWKVDNIVKSNNY
jgi:hypothetical protein